MMISAVMPCLDEARTLPACILKAQQCFLRLGLIGEVVVADNGSQDGSVEIARRAGARVIEVAERGYGAALRAGVEAAQGDFIIMADSDDSYDWSRLDNFIAKAREGFDLVIGNRFQGGISPGAMPPLHRYLGNPVLSLVARIAFRTPIGDFHCGMRGFTREAWTRMQLQTTGMEFATEMIACAARQGLRIAEVPTTLAVDGRDRRPHLRSFRDGWRHLRFILSYAPDHLYLIPGTLLLALGLLLQCLLATGPFDLSGLHLGIHFLALGGMLTLVGFNLLYLGVIMKVVLCIQHPVLRTPFIRRIQISFTLEKGLVAGGLLTIGGLITDGTILAHWLTHFGTAMEKSIHAAFVASQAVALGVNIMFSAFLLSLLLQDRKILGGDRRTTPDATPGVVLEAE